MTNDDKKMNVLHILKNSFPFIVGSTIRSKNILKFQESFCIPHVCTGYNFGSQNKIDVIEGIKYFRFGSKKLRNYNSVIQRTRKFIYYYLHININFMFSFLELPISFYTKRTLKKIIKNESIDVVHQHSDVQIGKFSQKIAKKLNKPYVYEVRAFLEDGLMVGAHNWRLKGKRMESYVYNNIRNRETKILKNADKIVTLSPLMKEEIISRGINGEKVHIVPNSVDISDEFESPYEEMMSEDEKKFLYTMKDDSILGTKEDFIISYIGTIEEHEGIHILLKAISKLKKYIPNIQLFLVGKEEKNYFKVLLKTIVILNLKNNVLFSGVIPHNRIKSFYQLSDFIVIPRLNRRVCRLVSPIKPLEAMLHGKLVITSDLPAMRYYIEPFETGVLFEPENANELCNKLLYFIEHQKEKKEIEKRARERVKNNFNWEHTIFRYKDLYEELLKNNNFINVKNIK